VFAISMLTLRAGQVAGSETYARGLAGALARTGTLDYLCIVPRDASDAAEGLPALPLRGPSDGALSRLVTIGASATRARSLRRRLPALRAAHYLLTVPVPPLGVPAAVTLHDLLHRDEPQLAGRFVRAFRAMAYDRPARRAATVVVPSVYVRDRAMDMLGLAEERVRVIPHGVDHERFRCGQETREPFLLYPAYGWPHKNHARLLSAFEVVRRERPDLRLVLTGGGHDGLRLPEGAESRGRVSVQELATLYRRASALVFPSLHEGFGLPVLEAMASGCPVACSNTTSLPEVCGPAAVYFDPRSTDDIAAGILRVLAEGDRLAERGVERAGGFTWEGAAAEYERVYRSLLEDD
jgi:glycosyltransferase involved in cell wall biosynthesis